MAEPISLTEVPQHFVDALLSMEDRRFYYHLGIDPIGLARAAHRNQSAGRIVLTGFGNSKDLGNPPTGSGLWLLEEKEALRTLLRGTVQRGSGRRARLPIAAFGKTGTSQEYRDAWFIGFAGNLVVGVWVGNDDFSPMKRVTGGSLPAEIWQTFMREAISKDKALERNLQEPDIFPAKPRKPSEVVQIATDTLGSPTTGASAKAKRPHHSYRNPWKSKRAERGQRGERRQGLASRGFLQHLFR